MSGSGSGTSSLRYGAKSTSGSIGDNYDFPWCGKCGKKHARQDSCPPPASVVYCQKCKQVHNPHARKCPDLPEGVSPCPDCWGFGEYCCSCVGCDDRPSCVECHGSLCLDCRGKYQRPCVAHCVTMEDADRLEAAFYAGLQADTKLKALAYHARMQKKLAVCFLGPPGIGKSSLATALQALIYHALGYEHICDVGDSLSVEHLSPAGYCGAPRRQFQGADQHAGLFRRALRQTLARILLLDHTVALRTPYMRKDTFDALPKPKGGAPGHRVVFVTFDNNITPDAQAQTAMRRLATRDDKTVAEASKLVGEHNRNARPLTASEKAQALQVIALDPKQPVHELAFALLGALAPELAIEQVASLLAANTKPTARAAVLKQALANHAQLMRFLSGPSNGNGGDD